MSYDIKIIRTWVEHPAGTQKNGKKKKPVFRAVYFNELTLKQAKMSVTLDKETPQAKRAALGKIKKKIQAKYHQFEIKSVSIGELAKKYYEYMESEKSGLHYQTRYQYIKNVEQFISGIDPTILASNIKITYFNGYFDDMLVEYSYSYVNTRRSAITSLYRFGVDYGLTSNNPLANYKLKRRRKIKSTVGNNIEDKYLEPSEIKSLFKYLIDVGRYDFLDLFAFMYLTGMRLG